ncbi:hypothetical protein [Bacillus sp. MRMR6]|uniref:hypothetical protein n=1 Tax=Bacillus sp. MRMR6 TaxID=1928617 RepID=UPI000950C1C2|nr:hypothetical protein [Bacillus sp. MRMR6]OLS39151.1 hypothetical protein BTR25_13550 [Bacillus sp. MRMR6]
MELQWGVLISFASVVIAYLAFSLNKQNTTKSETRQDAKIQAQLDYIGKGVDDIRIDLKANERQMVALGERVTRVEESTKQAHKRLDTVEKDGCS